MSVQRTSQVLNRADGLPVAGAQVWVYNQDGTYASLTTDGTTPITQPITTDEYGNYSYVAAVGYYREDTYFGGKLREQDYNIALGNPGSDLNLRSDLAASTGAGLAGFDKTASYSSTTLGGQMRRITDTVRFWADFGIVADATTDDTVAVQAAFDWLAPGKTLFMPGADIKITATLNLGNGTTTALSTKANNCTIIWGGDVGEYNFLTGDSGDVWTAVGKAGTRFIWAGSAGGTMMKWNGPIQGVRMIGAMILDCRDFGGSGTGASYGLDARSFAGFNCDTIGAMNWKAGGRGILLTTQQVTTIGGNSNPVVSANNDFQRLIAYSPDASASECIRIDGYRAANGQDVTLSRFRYVVTGFCGNNGKGLVLGFTDNCIIDQLVSINYRTIVGTPSGLYIDGGSTPWQFPSQTYIGQVSVSNTSGGGSVGVGGGTNSQVIIGRYTLDDGAAVPNGVTGLYIQRVVQTGTAIDQIRLPADGKSKTRAVSIGEGFYGYALDGTYEFSAARGNANCAHLAGHDDVEFEAGAASGPTTAVHFKVTTTGTGYPMGVGGATTQGTSKSTAVPLNKVCGAITLHNAALAANTAVSFTFTNNTIAADDDVRVWVKSGNASAGSYRVAAEGNSAGSRTIVVENKTAGSLSEALVLGFTVHKAAVA